MFGYKGLTDTKVCDTMSNPFRGKGGLGFVMYLGYSGLVGLVSLDGCVDYSKQEPGNGPNNSHCHVVSPI